MGQGNDEIKTPDPEAAKSDHCNDDGAPMMSIVIDLSLSRDHLVLR